MTESNLDVIIRTTREGDAPAQAVEDLQEMRSGLSDLEKAALGTRSTVGGLDSDITLMGGSMGTTADAMRGLGLAIPISPMELMAQATMKGIQFAKDSVTEYAAYGEEISKLAAFTSTSTEEMSRMYQVADDLRIPIGSLEMALKTMATNGTTPSIDGLASLSAQYLALQTPLEQSQFLIDNFGKSGQEMARLMGLGEDAIKSQAGAIEDWMIVSQKSQDEINAYMETQDAWDESIMEVKYSLATQLLPVITDVMNALMNTSDEVSNSESSWMRYIPVVGMVYQAFVGLKNLFGEINVPNVSKYNTGGGRAGGGDVEPFTTYKTGEREVEYLSMGAMGGAVTPSSAGGGTPIVFNFNSTFSTANRMELISTLTPIVEEIQRRTR